MLTLDTQQVERQRVRTRFLEQRERERRAIERVVENKEVTVAPDGLIQTTSLAEQMGTPMSSTEFVRRLKKMNPNLHFEISNADSSKGGIYEIANCPQADGTMASEKLFVCGTSHPFMPERSVRHMKKERVPVPEAPGQWQEVEVFTKETRGWRTVLLRLLLRRLITPAQIHKYFPVNLNSRNWQRLTT